MKRCMFKLVMFLLLGTIINVTVAWSCAVMLDTRSMSSTRLELHRYLYPDYPTNKEVLLVKRYSKPGALRFLLIYGAALGSGHRLVEGQPESLVPNWPRDHLMPWKNDSTFNLDKFLQDRILVRQADARGWPMYSVWCVWGKAEFLSDSQTEGGIRLPKKWTSQHDLRDRRPTTLPYRPIWPGFAINTIFYASLLWCVTLGQFTTRRFIRRKRGRCLKCGYNLRGEYTVGCPECGRGREAEA